MKTYQYSKEEISKALIKANSETEGILSKIKYINWLKKQDEDYPSSTTITNRYGWNNIKKELGLSINHTDEQELNQFCKDCLYDFETCGYTLEDCPYRKEVGLA